MLGSGLGHSGCRNQGGCAAASVANLPEDLSATELMPSYCADWVEVECSYQETICHTLLPRVCPLETQYPPLGIPVAPTGLCAHSVCRGQTYPYCALAYKKLCG